MFTIQRPGMGVLRRWDVAPVIERGHRLGVLFGEHPAGAYPVEVKVGIDLDQVRQIGLEQFFFSVLKIRVAGRQIVAAVDDVIAAIALPTDVVGVFD